MDDQLKAALVLVADLVILLAVRLAVAEIHLRGAICDGGNRWCDRPGEPTPVEWAEEMAFRTTLNASLSVVAVAILLASAVWAWRRGRHGLVAGQILAVVVVSAFAIIWEPYRVV